MNRLSINKVIELVWTIKDYEHLCFGKDKKLYNIKTSREIKKTINNRSVGYWIGKKFYSLNKLKPLLIRPTNFNVPF